MSDEKKHRIVNLTRRDFLRWMGIGSGTAALSTGLPLRVLAAARPDENPLAGSVDRAWEKIYRDQYSYDRVFDWVCSPNDTHACRVRAYVRNDIVTRLGSTYDYQNYPDLYGNKATANWNPRQCAKGYTFHRVIYGPYRLRHPIVRKGWKAWADAGFPELTPENMAKYLFDRRGQDEFIQISWQDAFHNIAKALVSISTRYS
ncbi:MAG: nitrate oxidoreductase subunit alpha, partial [Anaerolineales bacterium]